MIVNPGGVEAETGMATLWLKEYWPRKPGGRGRRCCSVESWHLQALMEQN
jgi:hypothetical protein